MSLDVSLYDIGKITGNRFYLFEANITHNITEMAEAAVIYKELWRPEEINATRAKHIIMALERGLADLKARPEYFKQYDSPNKWGVYENFVPWVEKYLNACKKYHESYIEADR